MGRINLSINQSFTLIKKYAWILTLVVAIGGLWYPRLGLLVMPIMISLITMSFFKGRYWCGNFCPHGSFFDQLLSSFSKNRKIPGVFRSKIIAVLFFLFFSYNLGRRFLNTAKLWETVEFWDKLGFIFVASYLMVVIVGGGLSIFISYRTWCHICPMGTMQRMSYSLGKLLGIARKTDSKVTISRKDLCVSCGKCAAVCPMQLSPYTGFSEMKQFDNELCIRCSKCVENCPLGILSLAKEA
ncbi:4Fe-4S binding protein [Halocella sp. SP3-1]|uniref:4Fe-4S binding protein n=1 Tax=Halocella sp. SP3-1 TaxID=2382161 RepID=UPI000F760AA2|nr:4Fe-4S binding protein [Halocella sp. SP3-1]AZO93732.1 4Fe-4S binding protein [Halocella sp. SP3-1]